MRTALIFLFAFSCHLGLKAQTLDSLGIDNSTTLNRQEFELLNSLLREKRDTFDFQSKKVAFVTGSSGNNIVTKEAYFKNYVKPWLDKGTRPQVSMVRLTEEEKSQSNGYDALVLSWVKLFTNKQKKRIVKRLSKKHRVPGE